METERAHILVELIPSYNGFKAKLGILTSKAGEGKPEVKSHIKESAQHFDRVFTKSCCGSIKEANPSASLEQKALSFKGMRKKDDTPYYQLECVQKLFIAGRELISHERDIFDDLALLLTWTEIEKDKVRTVVILKFL